MSAKVIDGRAIAGAVREEIRREVEQWVSGGGVVPFLTVLLVGDNPASASYVRSKEQACHQAGIRSETLTFPGDTPEADLVDVIRELNEDRSVHGILPQLPMPPQIDEHRIIRAVSPDKDVDGLHPESAGRLVTGLAGFVPATPSGILELLTRSGVEISGRRAVILGRSNLVGKPLAALLMRKGTDATVTVCHSRTSDLPSVTREADILVAAIGRAGYVTADMVKPGAAVIDVGINRVPDDTRERGYRLVGDVDFAAVREVAGFITPVPGGVGPMTVAMLLRNTFEAARTV